MPDTQTDRLSDALHFSLEHDMLMQAYHLAGGPSASTMYRVADDADKALMQAYSAYARHIDSDTGSKKTQAREVKELYQKAHELYEVQIKALKAKIKKSRVFLRGDHDYVLSLEHEAPECAVKLSKAVVGVKEYLIEALEEKLESVSGQLVVNRKMGQRYLEDLMAAQDDQKPVLRAKRKPSSDQNSPGGSRRARN